MRILTLILLVLLCSSLFAKQAGPPASTTATKIESSISSTTSNDAPAKYFVGVLPVPQPKSKIQCVDPPRKPVFIIDPPLKEQKHKWGDAPFAFPIKVSDGSSVKLTVTTGENVAQVSNSTVITIKKSGTVDLKAEESGTCSNKAESVTIELNIEEDQNVCVPNLVPQQPQPPAAPKTNAGSLIQYLGNPRPYSFQAVGDDKIVVYSERLPPRHPDLSALQSNIDQLANLGSDIPTPPAGSTPAAKPAYSIVVTVPHSAALGDLATRLSSTNYPDFAIQDVGSSKVRISSATVPDCATITKFLRDLRDIAWRPRPENGIDRLFFLNASDVTGPLNGSSASPSSSSPSGAASPSASAPATASAPGTGTSPPGNTAATLGGSSTGAASPGAGSSSATIAGGTSPAPSSGASPAAGSPSAVSAAPSSQATTVAGVGTDTLLFSDAAPGDDAAISEKRRLLALLDLPRPEMILNVWSLQTSSNNKDDVEKATRRARTLVHEYDDTLQRAIMLGWGYLRDEIRTPTSFFDEELYHYLTGRYVADPHPPANPTPETTAQALLNRNTGTPLDNPVRQQWGICPAWQYCLGYARIFQPLRPRLTDLLLAVIAAKDPCRETMKTIDMMEGRGEGHEGPNYCSALTIVPPPTDCVKADYHAAKGEVAPRYFYLECFRAVATEQFKIFGGAQPTSLGLLRAALADFLFNYKVSQIYPHEFVAYDLSQSAQTLNSALNPLVEAFNRDVTTFQAAMSDVVLERKVEAGPWAGAEKGTFVNNGLITVRTISGAETIVNTTSQSFLDATQQPTISALLNSIEGVHPGTATPTGSTTPFRDLLQNMSPIQAQVLMGTLSAVQTSKVQIGRSLNIDITPRSLAGASSAELTLKMNADESTPPTYFGAQTGAADLSRVANHDTTTRVRVDSIKLFDVSTLTAELQKTRTRFPLLPPFVEIPYVGTFIGVPLPAAREYHTSTAVLSTIVVPTAMDIALGLTFELDHLVDSDGASHCEWHAAGQPPDPNTVRCRIRAATFLSDLQAAKIRHYHKEMMSCIAMNGGHPKLDMQGHPSMSQECGNLEFDSSGLDTAE